MTKIHLLLLLSLFLAVPAQAAKKMVLDARIDEALEELFEMSSGAETLAKKSEGMLVFPSVKKAGLGVGGEYGEGALIIDGKKVQYYNTASASIGFQMGVQIKRQVLLFMDKGALKAFRNSEGWEVGLDGSVAIATLGAGGEIETKTFNQPVVAFIYGNKGLMYNLSLEGTKINKIDKK
ncbi:MAG: YSC84-related protein [Oceanipulchritudo sp.]